MGREENHRFATSLDRKREPAAIVNATGHLVAFVTASITVEEKNGLQSNREGRKTYMVYKQGRV
jgi:hypothetical protein